MNNIYEVRVVIRYEGGSFFYFFTVESEKEPTPVQLVQACKHLRKKCLPFSPKEDSYIWNDITGVFSGKFKNKSYNGRGVYTVSQLSPIKI